MISKSLPRIRWSQLFKPWENIDPWYLLCAVALMLLGSLMIESTEHGIADLHDGNFWPWLFASFKAKWFVHISTGIIGLGAALALPLFRYEILMQWRWIVYGIVNVLLVAVMFFGQEELGAQRWLNIFGFYLQPSEFAKLGVIIALAATLQDRPARNLGAMFQAIAVVAFPWVLIFLEPNLGTSLVFGAITVAMLYWGNANPGWLLLMASPLISMLLFNTLLAMGWGYLALWFVWVLGIGYVGWRTLPWRMWGGLGASVVNLVSSGLGGFIWNNLLRDYQKGRITMFMNPEQDPMGGGYHLIQSRIAIGAGELWGRGVNQGTQTQLNFIPEQHTDFIFAAVGEELGFVGSIAVLLIFLTMCFRLLVIAQNAKDDFGSLIAIGVFAMVLFQTVVNIGMTIGLSPVTGIPLPFLSYGRSALIMNFLAVGLVQSVANARQKARY
ncbi:MAG: rod shape-determining protein RodA [Alkalinema sp. RU_4_3]|nr:rod shape-determining protein RodA [Alkalinema sp. RU_4_3]